MENPGSEGRGKTLMCRRLQVLQPNRDFWCDRREGLRWVNLLIVIDAGSLFVIVVELNMVLVGIGGYIDESTLGSSKGCSSPVAVPRNQSWLI